MVGLFYKAAPVLADEDKFGGSAICSLQHDEHSQTEHALLRAHVSSGNAALWFAHTASFFRGMVVGSPAHRCFNLHMVEFL